MKMINDRLDMIYSISYNRAHQTRQSHLLFGLGFIEIALFLSKCEF